METPNPRLVRDIREGFCEEKTFKRILETTGHQSGESVIQAEETNAKTLDLRYFKTLKAVWPVFYELRGRALRSEAEGMSL